jgi:membrane protein
MKFRKRDIKIIAFIKTTFKGFFDDDCMRMAAALSYYAVFSLPPLLFLLITLLGYFFRSEDVRRNVSQNLVNVVGKENAGMFESLLTASNKVEPGIAGSVIGFGILVVGASVLMSELQSSLNKVWEVKPYEEKSDIWSYVLKRLLALSMLLIIAALLVLSLVFNTILTAFGEKINIWFDSRVLFQVLRIIHFSMSFIMLAFLFAWTFKVLPNAKIRWKDVWLGSLVTAVLFIFGNYLVGFYLGRNNPASAYGAAASLGVILIWIYYASMIFLFGAEFTRTWSQWNSPREES